MALGCGQDLLSVCDRHEAGGRRACPTATVLNVKQEARRSNALLRGEMQGGVQLSHGGDEGDPFGRTGDDPAHAEGLCLTGELSANCRRHSWCALEVTTSVEKPADAGGPCRTWTCDQRT